MTLFCLISQLIRPHLLFFFRQATGAGAMTQGWSGVWMELNQEKEWRDVSLVKEVSEWGMDGAVSGEGVEGCITSQGGE